MYSLSHFISILVRKSHILDQFVAARAASGGGTAQRPQKVLSNSACFGTATVVTWRSRSCCGALVGNHQWNHQRKGLDYGQVMSGFQFVMFVTLQALYHLSWFSCFTHLHSKVWVLEGLDRLRLVYHGVPLLLGIQGHGAQLCLEYRQGKRKTWMTSWPCWLLGTEVWRARWWNPQRERGVQVFSAEFMYVYDCLCLLTLMILDVWYIWMCKCAWVWGRQWMNLLVTSTILLLSPSTEHPIHNDQYHDESTDLFAFRSSLQPPRMTNSSRFWRWKGAQTQTLHDFEPVSCFLCFECSPIICFHILSFFHIDTSAAQPRIRRWPKIRSWGRASKRLNGTTSSWGVPWEFLRLATSMLLLSPIKCSGSEGFSAEIPALIRCKLSYFGFVKEVIFCCRPINRPEPTLVSGSCFGAQLLPFSKWSLMIRCTCSIIMDLNAKLVWFHCLNLARSWDPIHAFTS